MPCRVFVIAEVGVYRDGLAHRLECEPDCTVVGVAPDASTALVAMPGAQPDVVLIDAASPASLDAVNALAGAAPAARIVALAVAEREPDVVACAEAGMAAYVPREASVDDLLRTLARVRAGEVACPPRIAAGLFRRLAAHAAEHGRRRPAPALTRREAEILELLGEGLSNKEIARRLCIQVATVKNHVHSILDKLNVRRRGDAAAFARTGLVPRLDPS
jgi:two-component system nitrate/nitrite response regulator NarL